MLPKIFAGIMTVRRLLALFSLLLVLAAACESGSTIRVENKTDARICVQFYGGYVSKLKTPQDGEANCDWQEAQYSANWLAACYKEEVVWVVIKINGDRVYSQSAKCNDWEKTITPIVIEQTAGGFLAHDRLN